MIIVERRNRFHRELVVACALASIAIAAIILSALYAWVLWRRSRRLPRGNKGARSAGLLALLLSGLRIASHRIASAGRWLSTQLLMARSPTYVRCAQTPRGGS